MNLRSSFKIMGTVLLVLLLSAARADSKGVVIKIATLAPEGSSWMKTLHKLDDEIKGKTGGEVRLKIYPGGVLGDETDMMRKMHIGQINAAALTSGGLSMLYKEINILQIPFLFNDYGEVDYVQRKMDSVFKKGFEENGYVFLGWSGVGFVYMMSKDPFYNIEDIRKLKVWIWEGSELSSAIFKEAKVSGIPLSVPDVMVGLQTGLVDVVYSPPTGAISLQWFTKVKYLTDFPLSYIAGGMVMRKDQFDKINPAYQPYLKENFQRHLDVLKDVTRRENQEAIEVMARHGVKVVSPSPEMIVEFKDLWKQAMSRAGSDLFSKDVLDEISRHLQDYRKGAR